MRIYLFQYTENRWIKECDTYGIRNWIVIKKFIRFVSPIRAFSNSNESSSLSDVMWKDQFAMDYVLICQNFSRWLILSYLVHTSRTLTAFQFAYNVFIAFETTRVSVEEWKWYSRVSVSKSSPERSTEKNEHFSKNLTNQGRNHIKYSLFE